MSIMNEGGIWATNETRDTLFMIKVENDRFDDKEGCLEGLIGKFYCYGLGDYDLGHSSSQDDYLDAVEAAMENGKLVLNVPIYALIHSGIRLSIHPFNDPWDGRLAGYVLVTKDDIREYFGEDKEISKKELLGIIEKSIDYIEDWANGELYCITYRLCKKKNGFYIPAEYIVEYSGLQLNEVEGALKEMLDKLVVLPEPPKQVYVLDN